MRRQDGLGFICRHGYGFFPPTFSARLVRRKASARFSWLTRALNSLNGKNGCRELLGKLAGRADPVVLGQLAEPGALL